MEGGYKGMFNWSRGQDQGLYSPQLEQRLPLGQSRDNTETLATTIAIFIH